MPNEVLTDRQRAAIEILRRREAQESFLEFCQYMNKDFRPFHHTKIVASELELLARGETPRLILTEPPQYGKSAMSSEFLPAYIFGRNPDARILLLSYGATLAGEFNTKLQKIMDSPEYLALFPGSALGKDNVRTQSDKPRRNSDVIDIPGHSGMFVNAGIGGGYTGKGFDYIILDDLIKSRTEADSVTYRDATESAFTDTIKTRRRSDKTCILILNTRWHPEDLTGNRIRKMKENPESDQWRVVNLPVLLSECENPEEERWKFPPNQEPGKEVLWPEHFSFEDVMKTKADSPDGYNFSAQYMGNPVARSGNAIKRAWYEPHCHAFEPSDVAAVELAYDIGYSDSVTSDWTWGSLKCRMKDGSFLTLWQHFGHWESHKRNEEIKEFGGIVKRIMTELFAGRKWWLDLEAGIGGSVEVVRECRDILIGAGLPARTIASRGNKVARATAEHGSYVAACGAGRTKLYVGGQLAPWGLSNGIERWVGPYLNEVTKLRYSDDGAAFVGGKDDMLDAETMAHNGLTAPNPMPFITVVQPMNALTSEHGWS